MENPSFFLEGVVRDKEEMQDFEGPLSLILMLLQKNKIEISDIKIADILDQYLAYLEQMQKMDLEVASEFVQMAAHLLYIKTKTLLTSGVEEVSELELLKASLEQLKSKDVYESLKLVCPELKRASELGLMYFSKMPEAPGRDARAYEYKHEPQDLLRAMLGVCLRGVKSTENEPALTAIPARITYSVRDKCRQILEHLNSRKSSLKQLYMACASRSEVVATFLSILELCSMGSIKLVRDDDDYTVEFYGGEVDEIIERIEE